MIISTTHSTKPSLTLKDYAELDLSNHVDLLLESIKAHYHLESIQQIKKRALDLLALQPGERVIELGCGLGFDAERMGEQVGTQGTVIAIDNSKRMLFEAQQHSTHSNVTYQLADVNALPFENNRFSACRMDRLLVSQQDVEHVLSEALRIIEPGGKLCITDLDFGTLLLYPDLNAITSRLIHYWQHLVKNPFIGRQLLSLFRQYHLLDIQIAPEVFVVTRYKTLREIVPFDAILNDMVQLEHISNTQRSELVDALEQADANGGFFWSINLVTVVGEKKIV